MDQMIHKRFCTLYR